MDRKSKCSKCKYCRQLQGFSTKTVTLCCLYILMEGRPRGEPAGDECSKFEPRRRRMRNGFPDFTRRNNDQVNKRQFSKLQKIFNSKSAACHRGHSIQYRCEFLRIKSDVVHRRRSQEWRKQKGGESGLQY